MSYQLQQITKLKNLIHSKQQQMKRQRALLNQRIELLQLQIAEYQQKQIKNRQLNESIMMSYKQNDSFREQYSQKQFNCLNSKYQQEIKMIKKKHGEQMKKYQEENNSLKGENSRLKLDIQRFHLEKQKQIAQITNNYEEKLMEKGADMNNIFLHRFQLINQRLKQSQDMNNFYKNQLQTTKKQKTMINIDQNQLKMSLQLSKQNKKRQQTVKRNHQYHKLIKKEQDPISAINQRINRALIQLNPNRSKLDHQIRKIRDKIYDH